jgi:homoserine O-acetyltransferase
VELFLEYNGYNFTKWFDPLSYLYITKAINIYDLSRGFDSLSETLQKVGSELHLVSFSNDLLFKSSEMKEISDTLKKIGNQNHTYIDIKSDYGHDAFLVEVDKFEDYVRDILNG